MNKKTVMAQIRIAPVLFTALLLTTLVVMSAMSTAAHAADALYKRSFVGIRGTGPAVLYQPTDANAKKSHIGILVMHPNGNFLEHITILGAKGGPGLASLGYTVLAQNSTMSGNDILDTDKLLLEVSKGVSYLRSVPGVTKVVLLGHSGGGPTMAAYQFIAENGVAACQGKEKIVPCPNNLAGMPAADGLILLDSSLGFGAITLTSLDPAITDENKATQLDPKLDLYNPANGFHPPTGATYSPAFVKEYAAAQAKRMNKLIAMALDRLAKINAGQGKYVNDEPFDVPGSELGTGQIYSYDITIEARTHDPHWLVKPDGTRVNQVVQSLREPYKTASSPVPKITSGYVTTVRRFLNTWACRALPDYAYGPDYISGIDYQSTYNSVVSDVEKIKVPLLILGMSAGQLLVTGETIFNHATSADKSLIFIEGATHGTTPINDKYGNTTTATVNTLDSWISGRF